MEDMDNDVARIHQYPVAAFLTLYRNIIIPCLLECLDDIIRKRSNMARRSPAGYDHAISKIGFARQVNADDVFGFMVVEGGKNDTF